MNRLILRARMSERGAQRFTPAGLPALDFVLEHESAVTEAGQARKVSLEIRAVAVGDVCSVLTRLNVGDVGNFAGFLGSGRNGRGQLFHVTEIGAS